MLRLYPRERCILILFAMRHKYETRGIVLSRTSVGEANAFVTLVTEELGLVHARAQGVRRSGAKLAPALATFTESNLVLVRGKEGWRIAGAVLEESWSRRISQRAPRIRAARVSGLLLRLVAGEAHDPKLFPIMNGFFKALVAHPENLHEPIEMLAVLRVLAVLGFDTDTMQGDLSEFVPHMLAPIVADRIRYISRINRGIAASGL